jgi:hypothetical protein
MNRRELLRPIVEGRPIRELAHVDPRALPAELLDSAEPLVVRGLVAHWPMVTAARESAARASAYLLGHYRAMKVTVLSAPPGIRGHFFYDEHLTGFNFRRARTGLDAVLADLARASMDPQPPAIYVGSTTVDDCLPGFRAANDLAFGTRRPHASIWIGNRTRIATHHDLPTNLACVVAGRRRFTLFPPEQVGNLYVGPLEFTPAGQPISLVDCAEPDLGRFPRFAEAQRHARVAELSAGDAILIPSLWWHCIEGLDALNVLVNYWWRRSPEYRGAPIAALLHTMLAVRDLPPEQREAWRELFRHYVFDADSSTAAHIPPERRGALGDLDEEEAKALRTAIMAMLNR